MLVKGKDLTTEQRKTVLQAFVYRWTTENLQADSIYPEGKAPTIPKVSDTQWILDHAFYFNKTGSISLRHKHCEPVWMACANKKG